MTFNVNLIIIEISRYPRIVIQPCWTYHYRNHKFFKLQTRMIEFLDCEQELQSKAVHSQALTKTIFLEVENYDRSR